MLLELMSHLSLYQSVDLFKHWLGKVYLKAVLLSLLGRRSLPN